MKKKKQIKKNIQTEMMSFSIAGISIVEEEIEFNGKTYKPTDFLGYVKYTLCHSLPAANLKQRALTAATMANSFKTAISNLANIEHWLKKHHPLIPRDRIVGHIVDVDFPDKETAMKAEAEGNPVPLYGLSCVYKNAEGVEKMLLEMATKKDMWGVSFELSRDISMDAFLWNGEFIRRFDAPEEMEDCVSGDGVDDYQGSSLVLVLGGEDGNVDFTGHAMTKNPADPDANVEMVTASSNSGESVRLLGYGREVASIKGAMDKERDMKKGKKKPVHDEAGELVIGRTEPAEDGHAHEILSDLTIRIAQNHGHYPEIKLVDLADFSIKGVTSRYYWYDDAAQGPTEHEHIIELKGNSGETGISNDLSINTEASTMKNKDDKSLPGLLKKAAGKMGEEDKSLASELMTMAEEVSHKKTEDEVAAAIQEKVDAGELVEKETHEKTVEAAKEEASGAVKEEYAAKEAEAKERQEKLDARLKTIEEAGFDLKAVIDKEGEKEITMADSVENYAFDEAGEKAFETMLKTAKSVAKNAVKKGKDVASETASLPGKGGVPFSLEGAEDSADEIDSAYVA